MAAVTTLVCDVCQSANSVRTVHVIYDGQGYDVELCGNHMRPVVELTAKGRKTGARRAAKARTRYATLDKPPAPPAGFKP